MEDPWAGVEPCRVVRAGADPRGQRPYDLDGLLADPVLSGVGFANVKNGGADCR
jgi:hypothetical protein